MRRFESSAADTARATWDFGLCRYVEDNLTARDLGAAKLAATFGLSRASLYRLFAPVGGVASFIRERRLARAHLELTTPGLQNRRIGPIAYQAGFHSIAAFNRAFRAAYGETPRNVRKPNSGFTPSVKRPDEIGILARWLLETWTCLFVGQTSSRNWSTVTR
jgi:AraC-like DNA-binding protein